MTTTNPKMNVKLTSKHGGREVLLNWNNVNFIMNVKDEKLITPIITYRDALENTLEHHNDIVPLSDSDKI